MSKKLYVEEVVLYLYQVAVLLCGNRLCLSNVPKVTH